jgi:hypothetical protein
MTASLSSSRCCLCAKGAAVLEVRPLQAAELHHALLQAITGITQLAAQLAVLFPTGQTAKAAEPWMSERTTAEARPHCTPNLVPLWDELSVVELRSLLRSYPIDRTSLPAPIELLRRSELIEALNQIQALAT